jgi:MFS family permease
MHRVERDGSAAVAGTAAVSRGFTLLDMNGYQWTVLFAAWLGWGFDVFDSLLFNYVAPNAVPSLLGIPRGTPAAAAATLRWTGILTSLLLVGWALGGIIFGRVADRIGRTRTLLLTMALYSLGTAACAFAPNIWVLMLFRAVAALGIGGEWAAGAAMVAEVVPEKRRVEAGALLYTSAPIGLFLATFITYQIQGVYFRATPDVAWRYVFLFGLLPAIIAFFVRLFIKEPERWKHVAATTTPPRIAELFAPEYLRITLTGFGLALTALIMWWSCNAFIPVIATGLAAQAAAGLSPAEATTLIEQWKATATNMFNFGGLLGTLLTIPASKLLGRRPMYAIYFAASAAALMAAFGLPLDPYTRLYMYFPIGLAVFGVFGSFTYYLPELYPTRLRGTGPGFTYNVGRLIAAIGPFMVGAIAARGVNALDTAMEVLFFVGVVPLAGLALIPFVIETKGRPLID